MRSMRAAAIAGIVASAATGLVVATGSPAKSQTPGPSTATAGQGPQRHLHPGRRHGDRPPRADPAGHQGPERRAGDEQDALRRLRPHRLRPTRTRPVTDSAAAATAYRDRRARPTTAPSASTRNGKPVPTLLEQARAAGKSTGLVTTSQVTDATPAAFGAHVRGPLRPERDRAPVHRGSQARRDPRRRRGLLVPGRQRGRLARPPAKDPTEESKGTKGNLVERAQRARLHVRAATATSCAGRAGKLLGLFANEEMFEHRNEGQGDLYEPSVPLKDMATQGARHALARPRRLLPADRGGGHRRDGPPLQRQADGQVRRGARRHRRDGDCASRPDAGHARARRRRPRDRRAGDRERRRRRTSPAPARPAEDGPIPVANSNLQMTVDWTTGQHTGAATPITADGPGAGSSPASSRTPTSTTPCRRRWASEGNKKRR